MICGGRLFGKIGRHLYKSAPSCVHGCGRVVHPIPLFDVRGGPFTQHRIHQRKYSNPPDDPQDLDQILKYLQIFSPVNNELTEKRKEEFEKLSIKEKFQFSIQLNKFLTQTAENPNGPSPPLQKNDMTTEEIIQEVESGGMAKYFQSATERYGPEGINLMLDQLREEDKKEKEMKLKKKVEGPKVQKVQKERSVETADKGVKEVLVDEYTKFIQESVKTEGGFGGFVAHSPESFKEAFGGVNSKRSKWLKKEAKDLLISDIPALLLDYQRLAADHVILLEKIRRLDEEKNEPDE